MSDKKTELKEKLAEIIHNFSWRHIEDEPDAEQVAWYDRHNKALEFAQKEIEEEIIAECNS